MPELAEVEFYRKRWDLAARGERVVEVLLHDTKRVFAGVDTALLRRKLLGARLISSEAKAKQMLFRFGRDAWLGVHLGMSGELSVAAAPYLPSKHDHLVLVVAPDLRTADQHPRSGPPEGRALTVRHALIYNDPRMFGRVQFHIGKTAPLWWAKIAPSILSPQFTAAAVADFLQRRARAPIKAVLLMQERFPGVGNWMADEILWRAAIHPARLAGSLSKSEVNVLCRECRRVCRQALDAIAGRGNSLPPDLNVNIPRTWLFKHRWRKGGKDPITGTPLAHATIGGRTTCWSPARQKVGNKR